MTRHADPPGRPRPPKPLLGFGRAGWALLVPLAALIVVHATGFDLRYRIQAAVHEVWGWDGSMFLLFSVIAPHQWTSWYWPPMGHFGLVSMCVALLAMQAHPARFGAIRTGLVVVLGLACPTLLYWGWTREPLGILKGDVALAYSHLALALIGGAMLGHATRSWRVGVACTGVLLVPALMDWTDVMMALGHWPRSWGGWLGPMGRDWSGIWTNVALAGVLWTWAVRARVRVRPAHCCGGCGYDLRGLAGGGCPECGVGAGATLASASQDDAGVNDGA